MEVRFTDRRLLERVTSPTSRNRLFGHQADLAELRLQQLWAAPCLGDLHGLPGNLRELVGDPPGRFGYDLAAPHYLIFKPTDNHAQTAPHVWGAILSVTVLDVATAAN